MVITLTIPIRAAFKLHDFVTERHLDNMAKLLLATGLIVAFGYLLRSEENVALGNGSNRGDDVGGRPRLVDEAARAGLKSLEADHIPVAATDEQDPDVWAQRAKGLGHRHTRAVGEVVVDDRHVRAERGDPRHRLCPRGCRADDMDVRLIGQHRGQRLGHQPVVVDDEHADAAPGGFATLPVISVHVTCFPGGLPEVVAGRCPLTRTLGTLQAAVGPAGD